MFFTILGRLTVEHDGKDVTPTAPKVRQVLAFLLARRNQIVGFSELVDELWPDGPPRSAMTTVQTYIYKLRKDVLDLSGTAQLTTESGGYLLTVPDDAVDEHRFETLRREGRRAHDRGDLEAAFDLLTRALAFWRGPALLGVRTGDLLAAHVARLQEDRLAAHSLRVEVAMQLGRHEELTRELRGLVADYPFHERLHAHLMTALDRCGRRYEALQVYRRFRDRLVEELGLEPSAEIQQLQRALLSRENEVRRMPARPPVPTGARRPDGGDAVRPMARPALQGAGGPPGAGIPRAAGTSSSVRPLAPAVARRGPDRRPGPDQRPAPLTVDLPAGPDRFVGRLDVLRRLGQSLAPAPRTATGPARVALVCGMAGIGKTAVALRAARAAAGDYPDGHLFADLRGSTTRPRPAAEVLAAFLRALDVPEHAVPADPDGRARLFAELAASRRLLVVLDDAESVAQVAPLLPGAGAAVVSSRSALPDGTWQEVARLDALDTVEGVELLAALTGEDRVWPQLDEATRIVQACGGLPLALAAVGAKLSSAQSLPLGMMAALLASDTDALDHLDHEGFDVRASLDLSYFRLDGCDRSALRLLSLLPSREFTRTTAAGLLGSVPGSAEELLDRLADRHLLCVRDDELSRTRRYRLHPLLRVYLRERLRVEFLSPGAAWDGDGEALESTG